MQFSKPRIAIIGLGNLGTMLAARLIQSGEYQPSQLVFGWISAERLPKLSKQFPECIFSGSNRAAVTQSEVVVFAVKPSQFEAVAKELMPTVDRTKLFISLMAVVRLRAIQKVLQTNSIVRCATTIGIQSGLGTNVWISCKHIDPGTKIFAQKVLSLFGRNWEAPDEKALDKAIVVSGCMFGLVAAHINAYLGPVSCPAFPERFAREIIAHTISIAANYCLSSERNLGDIVAQVATKGGITAAMLEALSKGGAQSLAADAVRTGLTRIKQVSRALKA